MRTRQRGQGRAGQGSQRSQRSSPEKASKMPFRSWLLYSIISSSLDAAAWWLTAAADVSMLSVTSM